MVLSTTSVGTAARADGAATIGTASAVSIVVITAAARTRWRNVVLLPRAVGYGSRPTDEARAPQSTDYLP